MRAIIFGLRCSHLKQALLLLVNGFERDDELILPKSIIKNEQRGKINTIIESNINTYLIDR